jgi:pimeloyl-ACP methyl ester carboxylesterase
MAVVPVHAMDLYYEVRGAGAPILGIHGTPSSSLMWQDAASRIARVGQCIIYDRRGFSRSRPPDPFDTLDLGQHVDDAVGLLDHVTASPAIVIGRSTGGLIALELARRAPSRVRALVLLEPAIFSVDPISKAWAETLREVVLSEADRDPGICLRSRDPHRAG